jgi:hypothetical protein
VSDFIREYCCLTNQNTNYYTERVAIDLCVTRCFCVACNPSRQSTLPICRLIWALHAHSIQVQLAWYPCNQSLSIALEWLSIQVVEFSVLLE